MSRGTPIARRRRISRISGHTTLISVERTRCLTRKTILCCPHAGLDRDTIASSSRIGQIDGVITTDGLATSTRRSTVAELRLPLFHGQMAVDQGYRLRESHLHLDGQSGHAVPEVETGQPGTANPSARAWRTHRTSSIYQTLPIMMRTPSPNVDTIFIITTYRHLPTPVNAAIHTMHTHVNQHEICLQQLHDDAMKSMKPARQRPTNHIPTRPIAMETTPGLAYRASSSANPSLTGPSLLQHQIRLNTRSPHHHLELCPAICTTSTPILEKTPDEAVTAAPAREEVVPAVAVVAQNDRVPLVVQAFIHGHPAGQVRCAAQPRSDTFRRVWQKMPRTYPRLRGGYLSTINDLYE